MKNFEEKLADLISDEFIFPGNPEAVFENVISALEIQLMAQREEYQAFKEELKVHDAG